MTFLQDVSWGKEQKDKARKEADDYKKGGLLLEATRLGPPVLPVYPFLGEGSPTKIDYGKKGY